MSIPLLGYVPVPHSGYLKLFKKYERNGLYLFGDDVLSLIDYLARDMRALEPRIVARMIYSLDLIKPIVVVDLETLMLLQKKFPKVAMPDEDISREVARRYFTEDQVIFENVFLRWHQMNVTNQRPPEADRTVTTEEAHRHFINIADEESKRSPDWWRQIGACAVRDSVLIVEATHNTHFPAEQSAYIVGDSRTPFKAGERIDLSLSPHAERDLIGRAACKGVSLKGADLYVTTFPCPGCAYQIAIAGFKRVFYRDGYSLLDADRVLKQHGVELIRVEGS